MPLIGSVLKPLAKSVLIPLGLIASASATDVAINEKMLGHGMTTLIISNLEINHIIKIVKSLEESCLLMKWVSETIKNEAKEQKGGFLAMLLGTLGATLLENLFTGKGTIRAGEGTIRAGEGTIKGFLMQPHLLPYFETLKYYQNEPEFTGVYSRNNLPKLKDGAHVISLDEFKSIGIHWIALCVNGNNITYFDSFGVEQIPQEIKKS